MLELLRNKRILLVVAHPDDELLGPGGTMNRLIKEYNCSIRVVILGEGITARSDKREPGTWQQELALHRADIYNAQKHIGYRELKTYDFPDNRFDSVDLLDLVKVIETEKNEFHPQIIFTHHGGDLNIDHQMTFEAVITACRPMAHEEVKCIIAFETPSGTEWRASSDPRHFLPNLFFEISEENLEAKIRGMECYQFERREYPHPRSPEALRIYAQRWGVTIGKKLAEAFVLVRLIS